MKDIVLLLDNYMQDSQRLHESFRLAGYGGSIVVIEEDGFLPEDVLSVYGFFLGDFKTTLGVDARPKYFNEIQVPDYWEISGDNGSGSIHDLYRERGKIFYAEPGYKRLVSIVDWYDERGVVRFSDHYNRYGVIYARTIFNARGQKVNRSYFSPEGVECIVENYVTEDIILNGDGATRIFKNKVDFVKYFLIRAGFAEKRLFYNSLSTPFFVSNLLEASEREDVLFWQEPTGEEIPGNMRFIFEGNASRTAKVIVQTKQSYDQLLALGANQEMLSKLGYIYSFKKENRHSLEALICTNSDNLEKCEELIKGLPDMHFHIMALTEMSSKLKGLEAYESVSLYPNAPMDLANDLFMKCDYYFDINHESEILSALYQAFLHNQLIFSFENTVHNRNYVAEERIYPVNEVDRMIADVQEVLRNADVMDAYLGQQRETAFAESADQYRKILGSR